jgi:hypothetical protein
MPAMSYLDYGRLDALDAAEFQARTPYPFVNPEGVLTREGYQRLLETLPDVSRFRADLGIPRSHGQQPHDRFSLDYHRGLEIPRPWEDLIAELRGKRYARFLERMLGRGRFWLSFYWHYAPAGSSVSPHCDAQRKLGSHIFYFNTADDWDPAWGGQTVILDDRGRLPRESAPGFADFDEIISTESLGNRSLLFARREKSWHGVEEIHCPEGAYRKIFLVVIDDFARSLARRALGRLRGKRPLSY